jgi:hypothetical protein
MGMDYDGKPDFNRERDLFLRQISENANDFIDPTVSAEKQPDEDIVFDDLAKTYLKGEALKDGLADLNPLGYIPVEEESKVRAAVTRRAPDIPTGNIITFGLFKEACEYLAGSMTNANEEFLMTFRPVDVEVGSRSFSQVTKSQVDYNDDFISAFLDGLLGLAGVFLASYLADYAEIGKASKGVDSGGDTGEVDSKAAQGAPAGMAFMIELGITFAAYMLIFGKKVDDSQRDKYEELANDPAKRKAVLEDVGLDYEKFKRNQEWNDYKAIQDYSLKYIEQNPEIIQYDHWLGWMNVLENQTIIGGALAMAPTFSNKWRQFYRRGEMPSEATLNKSPFSTGAGNDPYDMDSGFDADNDVYESGDPFGPSLKDQLEDTVKSTMTQALRGYFSGLLTVSNTHYDRSFAAYSFYVDERILCCLIWFIGKVDVSMLRTISAILKLALLRISISLKDLLATILGAVWAAIVSLINDYIHKLVSLVVQKILSLIAKIPDTDLLAALAFCLGLEWLFKILDYIIAQILQLVQDIVDFANSLMLSATSKSLAFVEMSVERKTTATLAAFLDALADQFDKANAICPTREDPVDTDTPDGGFQDYNDIAADHAIKFVVEVQPNLFPILKMPEAIRRKHFSSVQSFKTSKLGLEVNGYEPAGRVSTQDDAINDCANNTPALKGMAMADKIAGYFNKKTS